MTEEYDYAGLVPNEFLDKSLRELIHIVEKNGSTMEVGGIDGESGRLEMLVLVTVEPQVIEAIKQAKESL